MVSAGPEDERRYYALNRRVYPAFSRIYDLVVLPLRRLRREVVRAVALPRTARVLDAATGTGEQALAFAAEVGEVVGIDLSEAMLGVASRKRERRPRAGNVAFQRADATALPFRDGSFDASCISFALHEMPPGVRERVVRELARVTRPGGSVTVVDYALPRGRVAGALAFHAIRQFERDHYPEFVRRDVGELLAAAGLRSPERRAALLGLATIVTARRPS